MEMGFCVVGWLCSLVVIIGIEEKHVDEKRVVLV